ncbi:hypothetical protein SESBI_11573 [Sesbania bispinosa]|nr:hypothetical protein SESBI_11573 [Sesbania bispinosa]
MTIFASYYYPPDIPSRRTRVPGNDDGGEGRPFGKGITSTLDNRDKKAAQLYVLLNCPEVVSYLNMYSNLLRELDPGINGADVDRQISTTFPTWFKNNMLDSTNEIGDMLLRSLTWVPIRNVTMWPSGLYDTMENDYYGVLVDIFELEYTASPTKSSTSRASVFSSFPDGQQDDDVQQMPIIVTNDDLEERLVDTTGVAEEVPISLLNQYELEGEEEEDIELISDNGEDKDELLDQDIEEEEHLEQVEDDYYDEAYEETDSN